ncbi:MAG: sensor histidine kinase [Phototrophicales bacterium]|nr:MAG: sensor histidine kinase [Phototrophicales bacterium]
MASRVRARIGWMLAVCLPLAAGVIAAALAGDWVLVGRFEAWVSTLALVIGGVASVVMLITAAAVWWTARTSAQVAARALEAARQQAQHEAAEKEAEARRRFLRRLDHELKNPLAIMRLGIENLQVGELGGDSVERLMEQTRRLSKLVEDLRRLADLDAGGLERERVDLRLVLQEAIELAYNETSPRQVQLSVQEVPWALSPVMGDRDLLAVAFRNLIDNAIKFTELGSRIEVRATENGAFAQIEIADSGRGIAPEDLPYIREELFRGRNAANVAGSGLGLPLVERIIALHGGTLDVRSRIGMGTVFTVRLPLAG